MESWKSPLVLSDLVLSGLRGLALLLAAAMGAPALDLSKVPASDWIQIFNKKDLEGWVKKISGQTVGQDPYDTWYVKDSVLWVDYKNYTGDFNQRFGHLAWQKRKFSYYLMRAEYQFCGTQATGGPDWGKENNGLLYHSQSMESMSLNQDFPASVEFQLLGEHNNQNNDGTTANVCGVGATMIIDGVRGDYWCRKAKPHNIIGQPWVKVEGLVLGDSISRHIVEGDTVLKYTSLIAKADGKPLKDGYISIQSETAPTKFKSIEVLDLEGCMDPKAANYRAYFLKSNPSRCSGTTRAVAAPSAAGFDLSAFPGGLRLFLPEGGGIRYRLEMIDLKGNTTVTWASGKEAMLSTRGLAPGVYGLRITGKMNGGNQEYHLKFALADSYSGALK